MRCCCCPISSAVSYCSLTRSLTHGIRTHRTTKICHGLLEHFFTPSIGFEFFFLCFEKANHNTSFFFLSLKNDRSQVRSRSEMWPQADLTERKSIPRQRAISICPTCLHREKAHVSVAKISHSCHPRNESVEVAQAQETDNKSSSDAKIIEKEVDQEGDGKKEVSEKVAQSIQKGMVE
jgi:hypothetical protein